MTEPNKYRIAIVTATFYKEISDSLLQGAKAALQEGGVARERIAVYEVPGTYEIPIVAKKLSLSKRWDAVVALGCVIRGETIHFDVIAHATGLNLQQISLETGIPITSGILMVENEEQAIARSSATKVNRGAEAAHAALSLLKTLESLNGSIQ